LAPKYNLSISSSLKAWIDYIVPIGKTFGYGPDGPHGVLGYKKVVINHCPRGSYEKGTPRENFDFQEPYQVGGMTTRRPLAM